MLRTLVVGLFLLALSGRAWALDERQWQAGVSGTFALALASGSGGSQVTPGGGARLDAHRGLTDALSAWAAVEALWFGDNNGGARLTRLAAGLTLAFNVVRAVPYLELGLAGQQLVISDDPDRYGVGAEAAVGVDYLLDPRWTVGAVLRTELTLSGRRSSGLPVALPTLGLRLARTF